MPQILSKLVKFYVNHFFSVFPHTSELSSIFNIEKIVSAKTYVKRFLTSPLSLPDSLNKG